MPASVVPILGFHPRRLSDLSLAQLWQLGRIIVHAKASMLVHVHIAAGFAASGCRALPPVRSLMARG